ncbi:hypothetical protein EMIHUDRAFT_231207 [Emiliania huxleyi CCMP1516]|uniref:Uncharacterized protein n=2 Tax=Emiliania huxleyi TaxID=2903 RepID=A0A0D3K868_EMIH1|nr:hypothetical protein EMIHUDRAFT_231207 [Emiliania huxleyi CCMP1516]EOD31953.1 hypothetical protein EMIHUDRAFT_231207 [Emiliania huxleyi CCMP1516]|eukprot:XP_005784382.1 hypothetical protein EMIHUDRAFT_231207 [Emiliania huxleyi CCMP1516]
MVPHVCECIQVLRRHYPGRLGVACLYNTPSYWYPFWKAQVPGAAEVADAAGE